MGERKSAQDQLGRHHPIPVHTHFRDHDSDAVHKDIRRLRQEKQERRRKERAMDYPYRGMRKRSGRETRTHDERGDGGALHRRHRGLPAQLRLFATGGRPREHSPYPARHGAPPQCGRRARDRTGLRKQSARRVHEDARRLRPETHTAHGVPEGNRRNLTRNGDPQGTVRGND